MGVPPRSATPDPTTQPPRPQRPFRTSSPCLDDPRCEDASRCPVQRTRIWVPSGRDETGLRGRLSVGEPRRRAPGAVRRSREALPPRPISSPRGSTAWGAALSHEKSGEQLFGRGGGTAPLASSEPGPRGRRTQRYGLRRRRTRPPASRGWFGQGWGLRGTDIAHHFPSSLTSAAQGGAALLLARCPRRALGADPSAASSAPPPQPRRWGCATHQLSAPGLRSHEASSPAPSPAQTRSPSAGPLTSHGVGDSPLRAVMKLGAREPHHENPVSAPAEAAAAAALLCRENHPSQAAPRGAAPRAARRRARFSPARPPRSSAGVGWAAAGWRQAGEGEGTELR